MDDRAMLELAANAAEIELRWHPDGTAYADARCPGYWGVWNTRTDDGDSRRLEVALRLHIIHNDPGEPVLWVSAVLNKRGLHGVAEFQNEDQRADATRLAVLRAAAEIGKEIAAKETREAAK